MPQLALRRPSREPHDPSERDLARPSRDGRDRHSPAALAAARCEAASPVRELGDGKNLNDGSH